MKSWANIIPEINQEQTISFETEDLKVFADTDATWKKGEAEPTWTMHLTAVHSDGEVVRREIETQNHDALSIFKKRFVDEQIAAGELK